MVNTFGDLRGALAATERINSVLSGAEIDEALAYALQKDLKRRKLPDPNIEALLVGSSNGKMQASSVGYMSSLKSASDVCSLARSGDIRLEGTQLRMHIDRYFMLVFNDDTESKHIICLILTLKVTLCFLQSRQ